MLKKKKSFACCRDYYDRPHRSGSPSPYYSLDEEDPSSHRQRYPSQEEGRRRTRSTSRDRNGPRRHRIERYHNELASGLDGHITPGSREAYDSTRDLRRNYTSKDLRNSLQQPRPSAFLAITGLPEDVDEVKLRALFAPIPGILNFFLWKDRRPTTTEEEMKKERPNQRIEIPAEFLNTATLEMHSMAAAAALLASEWQDNAYYNTHRLQLEYQFGLVAESDWMCASSFCCTVNSNPYNNSVDAGVVIESSTMNYAWRSQCYKCQAPRTPKCPAVGPEPHQQKQKRHQEQALVEAGWEPKAFNEAAVDVDQEEHLGDQIKEESLEKKDKRANDQQDDYELDSISGYLKHTSTGYLYDSNTGLYFHPTLQQWGTFNMSTGQFEQYKSSKTSTSTAPSGGGGSGTKAVKAAAVIGAAPQINTEALRLAEEERNQRKLQEQQQRVNMERNDTICGGSGGNEEGNKKSPAGQVQGVVHRGKWAQRRAAAQQEQQQQQQQQ